jgi:phosphatidylserine/phosphatidylglycerophosphate/cardiolipin synthase-like enzyme
MAVRARMIGTVRRCLFVALTLLASAPSARAADTLCDPSTSNCRTQLLTLIQNEQIGIDVGFWFMQDSRYMTEIVKRWQAGVPVRILIDPRANASYPGNDQMIAGFQNAGIPLRKRTASGILHWKMMLFAGQNTVEFGSANYSPDAFVPVTPYSNYVAETVYVTDDPAVVNSFKTKFDDSWTDTSSFANYANVGGLTRTYPTYPIDSGLNFPPAQDYATRAVGRYNAETLKLDAIMYRITDQRHTNAIISAHTRGVPVRLIVENNQYRDPKYLWDSWNVDRMYAAGIPLRWRGHDGENHEKLVLLYGQTMTIFGSSNWTTASANSQQEHNYFTTKQAIFHWFVTQFERMWNNANPAGIQETDPFVPLPPDAPKYKLPASAGTVTTATAALTWYAGPWAHNYDIYFGTSPTPPLFAANVNLGPSATTTTFQKYTTPQLAPGTTYFWKIVSKTMANVAAAGPVWSFTTGSSAPTSLPAGWNETDIGAVGVAGGTAYANGTFNVSGSGADVWGTADAFHFTYQALSGDGQMIARVASVANVNAWSKAGVMIRGSLSAGSSYAFMIVSAAKGSVFQYRAASGGTAASVTGSAIAAPYWVKIVRSGSAVTGYQSSDGASWTPIGSASIALGTSAFIGLAVTSHDNTRLCTASFTNVTP